jgi:hypothetical protein
VNKEICKISFVALWMRSEVENQHLVPTSRQCSSTSVRFGQGFLGKEQSDGTGARRILSWPDFG